MNKVYCVISAAATTLMFSNVGLAAEYIYSGFLSPSHVLVRGMNLDWANAVREASNGEIDFEIFAGGALLPALGTMQGVADGVAHAGYIAPLYHPSEMPSSVIVGEVGHRTPDPYVLSFAYLDYMMNDPVPVQEWRDNRLVPGGTASTEIYYYLCAGIVRTLEDLEGKRVRTAGAGWSRFSEAIGMTPVNLDGSEIYTSMERGAVDCVAADPTQLTSGANILELTDSIITMPMSPAYTAANITYNLDFWRSLSDEQRRLLMDEAAMATARTLITSHDEALEAMEEARASGVEIFEPDEPLTAAYQQWVEEGYGDIVDIAERGYRISDGQAYLDTFEQYVDKWIALLEGVNRTDADAVAEVLKINLFDQIDVSTYGMN